MRTLKGIPRELVTPLGNLIRKVAYTQLHAIRLVGIGIGTGNPRKMALPTTIIEGTKSMIDIVTSIPQDVKLKREKEKELSESIRKNPEGEGYVTVEKSFTDLQVALSEYFDGIPEDILKVTEPKTLVLQFMLLEKDMNTGSLQASMSDGVIPVPAIVLRKFKLDYSKPGELSYEIDEELSDELERKLISLKNLF